METANYRTAKFAQKGILSTNQAQLSALHVQQANIMLMLELLQKIIEDALNVLTTCPHPNLAPPSAVVVPLDGPALQSLLVNTLTGGQKMMLNVIAA
jgi:hypothetical protein